METKNVGMIQEWMTKCVYKVCSCEMNLHNTVSKCSYKTLLMVEQLFGPAFNRMIISVNRRVITLQTSQSFNAYVHSVDLLLTWQVFRTKKRIISTSWLFPFIEEYTLRMQSPSIDAVTVKRTWPVSGTWPISTTSREEQMTCLEEGEIQIEIKR